LLEFTRPLGQLPGSSFRDSRFQAVAHLGHRRHPHRPAHPLQRVEAAQKLRLGTARPSDDLHQRLGFEQEIGEAGSVERDALEDGNALHLVARGSFPLELTGDVRDDDEIEDGCPRLGSGCNKGRGLRPRSMHLVADRLPLRAAARPRMASHELEPTATIGVVRAR
jgi:hypothetical protein